MERGARRRGSARHGDDTGTHVGTRTRGHAHGGDDAEWMGEEGKVEYDTWTRMLQLTEANISLAAIALKG